MMTRIPNFREIIIVAFECISLWFYYFKMTNRSSLWIQIE